MNLGFSLIESLIVIALILIMFVMLHSRGSGSFQRNRKDECRQLMAEQFKALNNFALDHDGRFPVATNAATSDQALSLLIPAATTDTKMFICPGSSDSSLREAVPFAGKRISYAYYMGLGNDAPSTLPLTSDWQIGSGEKAVGSAVFSADGKGPGSNHHKYGGNVLFLDGSVRFIPPVTKTALAVGPGTVLLNPVVDPISKMTIKIQCNCGVKFAFEGVEGSVLADGSIRCPNCGIDATPTANAVLAAQAVSAAPAAPVPQPSRPGLSVARPEPPPKGPEPVMEESSSPSSGETEAPLKRSEKLRRQAQEETGALNKVLMSVGVVVVLIFGSWAYYNFSLSRPSQIYQSPLARGAKTWLLSETRVLLVESTRARLIEIPADREIWSTEIPKIPAAAGSRAGRDDDDGFGQTIDAELNNETLIVRSSAGVTFIDAVKGSIKSQVAYAVPGGGVLTKTASYSMLGYEPNVRLLVHQPLDGGVVSTQTWTIARSADPAAASKPKTNATAARLGPKPATASSVDSGAAPDKRPFTMVEFFAAPDHLIELKSELLEQTKVPRGKPKANTGPALTSTLNAAGGMDAVMALGREMAEQQQQEWDDISRIRVTVRRLFGSSSAPWTSEVAGPPTLFPMEDFDLLVAGSDIICLTRDNTIKWQAKLPGYLPPWAMRSAGYLEEIRARLKMETYERPDGPDIWFLGLNGPSGQSRAGARESAPVFTIIGDKILAIDRGNIALLEKETGVIKWRMAAFGAISVQNDGAGSIYVSSPSSDPYSQSKNAFADPKIYIIKIDLATGTKKWVMTEEGVDVVVAGKYLYAAAIGESMFAKASRQDTTKTAVARLRPAKGSRMWVQTVDGEAHGIEAVGRTILLQMKSSVEIYRYWDF